MKRLDVVAAFLVALVSSAVVTWWGFRHALPEPRRTDAPRSLR